MYKELNGLIREIVNARFAFDDLSHDAIQQLRRGDTPSYRGHKWTRQHFNAAENVRLGIEAAWQYSKWLQFPEMVSRLDDGFAALERVIGADQIFSTSRLTTTEISIASPLAIEGRWTADSRDGKEPVMARTTVADLEKAMEALQDAVDQHVENLNAQIAELEERLDEVEGSDRRKSRGREMSPEQRKAAGERMQLGRAKKLGLESVEQLRALKLRPGAKPTKAQIKKVKEEFPVG